MLINSCLVVISIISASRKVLVELEEVKIKEDHPYIVRPVKEIMEKLFAAK